MPFGEYELSPSLIGLSLLHTAHPEAFQRLLVRSSIPCYRNFNLAMCRSLGFASAPSDCTPSSGSLSLRVRVSSRLASPETATRRFIMQKARRHCACAAPTACRRKVSGSVSLPCSGCFSPFPHGTGSLSVSREYLALPDGPGGFAQDFTCPALLRMPLGGRRLRVRASHPLWNDFPDTSPRLGPAVIAVLQPRDCIATATVWALPRSLATTGGIISLFSLPAGTKMFQFPAFASAYSGCPRFTRTGCPIRRSPGQRSFAPRRGLSQLIASFIASVSQGIRLAPFLAFFRRGGQRRRA